MEHMELPQSHTDTSIPEVVVFEKTKKEVLNELGALRQDVYRMGANDSEIPEIDRIIEQFRNGECTAEEALAKVYKIKNSKQDYH